MSLNINAADVITYLTQVFDALWPLLAVGLGIMAVPMLLGAAKVVFSRRR